MKTPPGTLIPKVITIKKEIIISAIPKFLIKIIGSSY
jgi:hypothetical protein